MAVMGISSSSLQEFRDTSYRLQDSAPNEYGNTASDVSNS